MTGFITVAKGGGCGGKTATKSPIISSEEQHRQEEEENQLSLLALLLTAIRKSLGYCHVDKRDENEEEELISVFDEIEMEIGCPTNVQHITHVTFDRFHGFLGLPIEFQLDIPTKVPSASASVFGVSAESMQCSYDDKGNSVPIILLLLQERLYSQSGLKAEGIFRINPENGQEEQVRDQLNRGIVPDDIDVHCLAGLIKTWFRELPSGVLDGLSPEQVLQCNSEEDYYMLVKQLKPTEAALLNWAIDLMADVVEEEDLNKMNARNIAMVFSPNMTQMSDPLTALMHAVQVMNLLKTLITKTLRERDEALTGDYSPISSRSSVGGSEEEYDSQQEMETDCDEIADYSHNRDSEHESEGGFLRDVEGCFLRLDENKMCTQNDVEDAKISYSDSRTSSCRSSGTNGVESRHHFVGESQFFNSVSFSKRRDNGKAEKMDQLVETASSLPLLVSN